MPVPKLVAVAVLVGASCLAASASADAATVTCSAEALVKLSPGLSEKPAAQNMQLKGRLAGCSGEEDKFTGARFQIHERIAEPITCAALRSGAAATGGSIQLNWTPKPARGSESLG